MRFINKMMLLTTLFLLINTATKVLSQTMIVHLTDGTNESYGLTSSSKIYFGNDNFIFDETNDSTPIGSIRKITFDTPAGIKSVSTQSNLLALYPNPASDYIYIENLSGESDKIEIYSVTGKIVMTTTSKSSTQVINVSAFPKGVYLVKVNQSMAKFIKL